MNPIKRILLVEDSLRDAELTLDALSSYNLANDVLHLRDGAEALDYLYGQGAYEGTERDTPAVILLDLKMPKVSGMDVLRKIKADSQLRSIPVVVMTSSREEQDLINSYNLGVNAYVVKPVEFPQFVEAVRQLGIFWAVINQPPAAKLPNPCIQ